MGACSPSRHSYDTKCSRENRTYRVRYLTEDIKLLKQLKALSARMRYRDWSTRKNVDIFIFSDASFNIVTGLEYGKT